MVEINNQGINNYMAQQIAPQVDDQTTKRTSPVQEKQAVNDKSEKKVEQRGVILEISQDALKLSKAALNDEAFKAIMMNRRNKANLQAAIMEAKQVQENVTDKVSEMIEAAKLDLAPLDPSQTIAA